jgi:cyclopropane-fatty-acyl-phospholipid synthase
MTAATRQVQAARRLLEHLASLLDLRLAVRLWDGTVVPLGREADDAPRIVIAGAGVAGSLLRRPTAENLARHYAAGGLDVEGGDLVAVAERLRERRTRRRLRGLDKRLLLREVWPLLLARGGRAGEAAGLAAGGGARPAEDLIRFHYDVGNEFYALFLDPQMQYSCAYFTDWSNGLAQAQHDKLEMICRKLRLRPGERLLDVGCGWGGLVCHAARHHGVIAHGITLSEAQHAFAREQIARQGLQERVTVELRDYRELEGSYDKIASIGMYEHVGIANYPAYFAKLHGLLGRRGLLLNHGITRRAKASRRAFRRLRPEKRLILKYIFPGSELDHIGHTVEVMEAAGFEVHDVEGWREHYALTTRLWAQRLAARRAEAEALVGAPRYRLWQAYLAGVSVNFTSGSLQIYQTLASRRARGAAGLPPTRADLYQAERQVQA